MQIDVTQLYERQLEAWPLCRQRYEALEKAQQRTLLIDGCEYRLSYNAARAHSAEARITPSGEVEEPRPCFLCPTALPHEQLTQAVTVQPSGRQYLVAVNPYPITPRHLTIISQQHERQTLTGRLWDMAALADMLPGYMLFFNGACAGASAPDHMHFQAVPSEYVPMLGWPEAARRQLGVTSRLPQITDSDHCNLAIWTEGSEVYWLRIDRCAHRPWQYYGSAEAAAKHRVEDTPRRVIISPATLECCGLVPLCRQEDYDRMTPDLLRDLMQQCVRTEPMLTVRMLSAQQIRLSAEERVHSMNYVADGELKDVVDYGSNRVEVQTLNEYWCHTEPTTLEVLRGSLQTFSDDHADLVLRGSLHVVAEGGTLTAYNLVGAETYLKASLSAMAPEQASPEVLEAWAIICRTWLVACATQGASMLQTDEAFAPYRGIVRYASAEAVAAVERTRGIVLCCLTGHLPTAAEYLAALMAQPAALNRNELLMAVCPLAPTIQRY